MSRSILYREISMGIYKFSIAMSNYQRVICSYMMLYVDVLEEINRNNTYIDTHRNNKIPWVVSPSSGLSAPKAAPKAPAFGAGAHAQSPMAGAVAKAIVGTTDGGHLGILPWIFATTWAFILSFPKNKSIYIYI